MIMFKLIFLMSVLIDLSYQKELVHFIGDDYVDLITQKNRDVIHEYGKHVLHMHCFIPGNEYLTTCDGLENNLSLTSSELLSNVM